MLSILNIFRKGGYDMAVGKKGFLKFDIKQAKERINSNKSIKWVAIGLAGMSVICIVQFIMG